MAIIIFWQRGSGLYYVCNKKEGFGFFRLTQLLEVLVLFANHLLFVKYNVLKYGCE